MSVALRPPPELCRPVILTALASVAIGDAILALTGRQARIKWPNDLLVGGKKACGILIERHAETTVIGIGLNLGQTADELAAAGLTEATSLGLITGNPVEPHAAARVLIPRLDQEYGRLLGGERTAVEADWKWRVGLLGRPVTVELSDGRTVTGRLVEMGFEGLAVDGGRGLPRVIPPESVRHVRAAAESV
jgi:BirA family biotin operon repressor/biotin-[acetyl-CoA-carboxylase] ligase